MPDLILYTAKQFAEQLHFQNSEAQLYNRLFSTPDESPEAAFCLDDYTQAPFALTYRDKDGQSRTTQYNAGTGKVLDLPIASRKTPLSEKILDAAAAGVGIAGGFGEAETVKINRIVADDIAGVNMTKNKQALDVIADGIFYAKGPTGSDLDLDIDLGRVAGNNLTFDFTGAGTITQAFIAAQTQLKSQGCPLGNMVTILGDSWLNKWMTDTTVQAYLQNTQNNALVASQMVPPELLGAEGLVVLGQYRGIGMLAPIWVCAYTPSTSYVSDEGETATDFVADANALFFSLNSTRYKVNRGVNVLDENEKRTREYGDMIIDMYTEKDPVAEYIRVSMRHALIPAKINHTAKSVGTFS